MFVVCVDESLVDLCWFRTTSLHCSIKTIIIFCGTGERNRGYALLMMANKPETAMYRVKLHNYIYYIWHDGLWYKLWDMGVKGRMWRVIKKMYMSSRSMVLLEGEKSDSFNVEQGVAQGCSLSPILFSVFINDLLKEVEQAELGIQLSSGKTIGGMLFADDFVGVSDSKEILQKLIEVVPYSG